ncbi:MAG: hypothetical protein U5N58_06490 [Actinomycetota bacterium]|nr:hypothetical protein [Actinomycetota bacterium]
MQDADIVLRIGDRQVEMVPFVQDILRDSIDGILKNLRGYKPGKKIEITINR